MASVQEVLQLIKDRSDRVNIIVGGRRSGKTTLLKALIREHLKTSSVVVIVSTENDKSEYRFVSSYDDRPYDVVTPRQFASYLRKINALGSTQLVTYMFDEFLMYSRFELADFELKNLKAAYFVGTPNSEVLFGNETSPDTLSTTYENNIDAIGTIISGHSASFYELQCDNLECERVIYDSIKEQIYESLQRRMSEHTLQKFQFMLDEQEQQ